MSIPALLLAAVALVLSSLGLLEVLEDPYTDSALPWIGLCSPALTGLWLTLELAWRRDIEDFLGQFLRRTLLLNGVFVLVNLAVHAVLAWGPAGTSATEHPDPRTPSQLGVYVEALFFGVNVGYGSALVTGLLAFVLVVLPVKAVRAPRQLARANGMQPGADERYSRLAGLGMASMLVLCFAVPTLIVVGAETATAESVREAFGNARLFPGDAGSYGGDLAWAAGVLLIPVGLASMVLTSVATHKAQAAAALRRSGQLRR